MSFSHTATIASALRAASADLERRAGLLDRINVFPVVDADTGANLTATVRPMVRALEALDDDFGGLCDAVGQVLLRCARGNSGVIFAQFFAGFFESLRASSRPLRVAAFSDAAATGRRLAYQAVAHPAEGTMLTVMTDLAALLEGCADPWTLERHARFERALSQSVGRTASLMPRLAEAGVVDSGALGFHVFICGLALALLAESDLAAADRAIAHRLSGRTSAPLGEISRRIEPRFLAAEKDKGASRRYCVTALLDLPEQADPAQALSQLGDSVDVARMGRLVKVHVHCDRPEGIKKELETLGRIDAFDVDDMLEGLTRAAAFGDAGANKRFLVVGDSSMSLSSDLSREHGIFRFENYVNVHGEMVCDGQVALLELMKRMRKGAVYTTAQTSGEEIRAFLDARLSHCERLIYVAVGDAYTGTQKLARKVIAAHPERERIFVVDTQAASGQQGLICLCVARFAGEAKTLEELLGYAREQVQRCKEFLVIDDLKYLSRTGRVGKIKAMFAGALGVKPIVGHGSGGAMTYDKVRSQEAAVDAIAARCADIPGPGRLVALVEHTDDLAWTAQVASELRARLGEPVETHIVPLSATSAVHMGPGTWGVAVTRV